MTKLIRLTAAAAIFVCGAAAAETVTQIDVNIQYDPALLTSDTGAEAVLKSIKEQAKDACGYTTPVSLSALSVMRRDHACVDSVVESAVAAIKAAELEKGIAVPQKFAQITP